ncbi:MAG: acyl-CoA dehydrogenase C-terminal domain-containing protein, partial [Acetobacteraceae bacterium]|nr:acyl-CoA dehydrogenase C-terminal domain-containing protein [Acetobacteraceae bacterium]
EGTTGIQAADLVARKLPMQQGATIAALIKDMREVGRAVGSQPGAECAVIAGQLAEAVDALEAASSWMLRALPTDPRSALAASVQYMMLTGYVCGGWQLARAAMAAARAEEQDEFLRGKVTTAAFYAEQILPKAAGLAATVQRGASFADQLAAEQF